MFLVAAAHEVEQEQEHIDEVEIEVERPHDDRLAHHVGTRDMRVHRFDLLCVIGGEASEDQHTDTANDVLHRGRLEEHVDHHCDDQTDNAHDQEGAPTAEVLLGRITPKAEADEGGRRREESLRDGCAGILQEDRRQGETHDDRETPETSLERAGGKAIDAEAHHENERERRKHDNPAEQTASHDDRRSRRFYAAARKQHRNNACKQDTRSHIVIDFEHIGTETGVECDVAGTRIEAASGLTPKVGILI